MTVHEMVSCTAHTARCRCGAIAFGFRPYTDAAYVLERFHLARFPRLVRLIK